MTYASFLNIRCFWGFTFAALAIGVAQAQSANPLETPNSGCCRMVGVESKLALPIKSGELQIDEKSAQFDFGSGSQAFLLIELPAYKKPYSISIQNIVQNEGKFGSPSRSRVKMNVETLDEDFRIKRRYLSGKMKTRGMGQEKTVFINPSNKDERYIVVYGDKTIDTQEFTISQQDIVFIGTGFYMGGADTKVNVSANTLGVFQVQSNGLEE